MRKSCSWTSNSFATTSILYCSVCPPYYSSCYCYLPSHCRYQRVPKIEQGEVKLSTLQMIHQGRTEFIDELGRKFVIRHVISNSIDRDSLWVRLAGVANSLRQQIHHDTINCSLLKNDLDVVNLEYAVHLVPSLVTSDKKLGIRKQQDKHREIQRKAVLPYLRKVKKAAAQTILLAAEGSNQEVSLPLTIQTEIQTRMLKMPKSERSISMQEHNDIVEGYE